MPESFPQLAMFRQQLVSFSCSFAFCLLMLMLSGSCRANMILLHEMCKGVTPSTANETQLRCKLLNQPGYDPDLAPHRVLPMTTKVTLQVFVDQIISVETKNGLMEAKVAIAYAWWHPSFVWNATEYGGIDSILLHPDDLWVPVMLARENIKFQIAEQEHQAREVKVQHQGVISTYFYAFTTSLCPSNAGKFPFDRPVCNLTFFFPMYTKEQLVLENLHILSDGANPSVPSDLFFQSIEESGAQSVVLYANGHVNTQAAARGVSIRLKRQPVYYVLTLLLPLGVLSSLAHLSGLIPYENMGDRLGVITNSLLGSYVALLVTTDLLPIESQSVPHLLLLVIETMIFQAVAAMWTVIVMFLYSKERSNKSSSCSRCGDVPDDDGNSDGEENTSAHNHYSSNDRVARQPSGELRNVHCNAAHSEQNRNVSAHANKRDKGKKKCGCGSWKAGVIILDRVGCCIICCCNIAITVLEGVEMISE